MKNIVIRSGSLRMGGLERVLIEVLQNIDLKKYKISLLIEDDSGEENIFLKDIPSEIDLYFIKNKEMIDKTHFYRKKKKNIFYKMMYNYYMFKEHRYVPNKTKILLEKIREKKGDIDVFIDYDWGARRYIDQLEVNKKIVWIHNSVPNMLKKNSKIKRFGENIKKYDLVIAICEEMKKELESLYPFLLGKIKKIYNPFNLNRIRTLSLEDKNLTMDDVKLMKEKYFLAISRLDEVQKDYTTLIEGFKIAKEKGLKEKLYILGDGPSRNYIENLIKNFNLEKEIILLGQRKNPYIWLKNSVGFIHSSKYEGFGLVIVEALTLGKGIICSRCEVGPVEILENGKYGLMFEVGNKEELSKCILEFATDLNLKEKYENLSLERAEIFSTDVVMKGYEEVIDD
ncbi:MAG: glycosyltransferase [Cetobacterium sp.]|uniref:glycosyltransferase n=1 Tax=Cetobacterium sp. TaxID=2071632 RepID=UPI003F3EBD4D